MSCGVWFKAPLSISMLTSRRFLMKVSLSLCWTGQVSRSALKQPRSCNIFKALFCCLQAQDGPKPPTPLPPPSQQALLETQENGTVVKVTLFSVQQHFTPLITIWRPRFNPSFIFVYLRSDFLVAPTHCCHKRGGVWLARPSAGINWKCCCKRNVLNIVFKHCCFFLSFSFFYNCALKLPLHLLWTSWKLTATVCGYGITLMFALDPPKKIRTTDRLSILQAARARECRIVCLVIAEVEKKIKPWAPAARDRPRWWTLSARLELQYHVRGILTRCHVCSCWGVSSSIRSKQEAEMWSRALIIVWQAPTEIKSN